MITNMTMRQRHTGDHLRVIWAITSKDLLDGLRNKSILMTFLTVAFLMAFYKLMPGLTDARMPPALTLYDAGDSELARFWEDSPRISLSRQSAADEMMRFLGRRNTPTLGIVLPSDFDRQVTDLESIELPAYVDHWVSPDKVAELEQYFEEELSALTGTTIYISVFQGEVYTQLDSSNGFVISLGVVVLLSMFGLSVTPMLIWEERQTKTLDSLLISPAGTVQIVLSKAITSLVYSLAAAAIMLFFNRTLILQWQIMAMAVIVGALFTISLGLLLGTLASGKSQIAAITFILYQPLLLPVVAGWLAGLLPETLLKTLHWIPTVALGRVIRNSLLDSVSWADYAPYLAYVAAVAFIQLAVVVWIVRRSERL